MATYLIKLLHSDLTDSNFEEFNDEELREINYIKQFQAKFPKAKIGLVIAMTALRESLESVFKKIPGLKSSMVINPSETFNLKEKYDLLIVDEAHRLRQYKNIGWLGAFRKNNQKLGLDDTGNELDWIIANSKNQIFFYDSAQSIKPSDIDEKKFANLFNDKNTLKLSLNSQMRVQGGGNYIKFIDDLLNIKTRSNRKYSSAKYEVILFDSLKDLYNELGKKEDQYGLCRLIAGYSWPWASKENNTAIDIEIEELKFQWNQTYKDWINSPNAFNEIGCIHTTQGYDLNYAGVIFGKEIDFDKKTNSIVIYPNLYFDVYGKNGINDLARLKSYIINIYKTIMYRGIKGVFVYACNDGLRQYLKEHITTYIKEFPFRVLNNDEVIPYLNSVPLVDISAAAGNFSDLQIHTDTVWIELPFNIAAKKGYFVCKIVGESMNRKIPNGSYCLFKSDEGGSRNGKIVLVESRNIQDSDYGSGYTIKEYHSQKKIENETWSHDAIILKPLSNNPSFRNIELSGDELIDLKVRGIFERVLA